MLTLVQRNTTQMHCAPAGLRMSVHSAPCTKHSTCMLTFHPDVLHDALQVDVYSYGIVLWELWTGREPFEGLNYHALLHQMTSAGEAMRPPLPGSADWDAAQVRGAVCATAL